MTDTQLSSIKQKYGFDLYDPLTKTECRELFCKEMRYSQAMYYRHHHKIIKFRPIGSYANEMERIYFIHAMGIINRIKGVKNPEIPYPADLDEWIVGAKQQKDEN